MEGTTAEATVTGSGGFHGVDRTGRGKQDGERTATLSCDPAAAHAHAHVREGSICLLMAMEMTPPTTSSSYTYDGDTARFLLCQSSEGLPPPPLRAAFPDPSRRPPTRRGRGRNGHGLAHARKRLERHSGFRADDVVAQLLIADSLLPRVAGVDPDERPPPSASCSGSAASRSKLPSGFPEAASWGG
mmetsp:Transcript_23880/g.51054  ORF Transcript_23880/g.51054 Transcript_23880/m.51054 type:complete len:187 (+) Transcript_23880:176-736(+)